MDFAMHPASECAEGVVLVDEQGQPMGPADRGVAVTAVAPYSFLLTDGHARLDPARAELPSLAVARSWGLQTLDEILRDETMVSWTGAAWETSATDAAGRCVLRLRFSADG